MGAPRDFETSARYLAALVEALRHQGALERVTSEAKGRAGHAALLNPHAHRWWPPEPMIEFTLATERVGGPALIRETSRLAAQTFTRVARPLVGVLTSVAAPSPTLFVSAFRALVPLAVRPLELEWEQTSEHSARWTVHYQREVPPCYGAYWEGALLELLAVTQRTGQVLVIERVGFGFRLELRWT